MVRFEVVNLPPKHFWEDGILAARSVFDGSYLTSSVPTSRLSVVRR
jgi:hypothetical protein